MPNLAVGVVAVRVEERGGELNLEGLVAVEEIDLHLTPDIDAETLDGICATTVRAFDEPVSRLVLDAVDLQIERVDGDPDGK